MSTARMMQSTKSSKVNVTVSSLDNYEVQLQQSSNLLRRLSKDPKHYIWDFLGNQL